MKVSICAIGLISIVCVALACPALSAPTPRMLVEISDLSGPSVSPDGREVAIRVERASVERNTYDSSWYMQSISGVEGPRLVADGGVPLRDFAGQSLNEAPEWSSDSVWIYYRAQIGGEVQVWRANRDGSGSRAVTSDVADVEAFSLSADGKSLLYVVRASREEIRRAEETEYDQGIRIDGTVPVGENLFRSADVNGHLSSQRFTGLWVATQGLLGDRPQLVRVVDLQTGVTRDATPEETRAYEGAQPKSLSPDFSFFSYPARSRDNKVAYVSGTYDKGDLKAFDLAAPGQVVDCSDPSCRGSSIKALAWRPGRDEVIYTTSDVARGMQSLYDWNVQTGKTRLIIGADGWLNGGRPELGGEGCAIGDQYAICVVAAPNIPPRLERIDLETGERKLLYDPNSVLVDVAGPKAEFLTWHDDSGHEFTGQYFPPIASSDGRSTPLFITYYACGGYLRGGVGDEWPLASLAGAGIGALCINKYNGENAFDEFDAALSGVRSAIALLQKKSNIDPDRIGMGGLSFGSEATLWIISHSNLLAAASVTSSAVTPTYYWFHSLQPNFKSALRAHWGLGTPDETPELWRKMSPVYQTESMRTPLLMQMPEQEYLQTMEYYGKLANSTTPVELYVFPNEPHQKFQPRHKAAAYQRNLDWFRFWLQGYEDPDPAKADQYKRWEALRARQH